MLLFFFCETVQNDNEPVQFSNPCFDSSISNTFLVKRCGVFIRFVRIVQHNTRIGFVTVGSCFPKHSILGKVLLLNISVLCIIMLLKVNANKGKTFRIKNLHGLL